MSTALRENDFLVALKSRDLWIYLAWQDIRLRYRRSKIGPLWITLSMAIFCLALGVVYSKLFKADVNEYLPFLSVGFVFWGLISGMLGEFPNVFVDNASYIKDIRINPFTILFRMVTRHLITFAHNAVIIVGVFVIFRIKPSPVIFLVIPAMLLVLANLVAIGVLLSLFGARFRDVAPITQSLIQVLFFITPITWFPKLLSENSLVMRVNPFAHYLDLLRAPVLGYAPSIHSWIVASVTLVVLGVFASILYRAKAGRIPFWV